MILLSSCVFILRSTVSVPPAQVARLSARVVDESGNALPKAVVYAKTRRGPDSIFLSLALIGAGDDTGAIQPTDRVLIPAECDCQIIVSALGYQERKIEEVTSQLLDGHTVVDLGDVKLGTCATASVVVKDAAGLPVHWAEVVAHGGLSGVQVLAAAVVVDGHQ